MLRLGPALAALACLLAVPPVHADPPTRAGTAAADPALDLHDTEHHAVSPIAQGAVGAGAAVALAAGIALNWQARYEYPSLALGSQGASCRPCSTSDLSRERGLYYSGFAFLALGGALAITDIALIVIDARSRSGKTEPKVAWRRPLALGVRF